MRKECIHEMMHKHSVSPLRDNHREPVSVSHDSGIQRYK